MKILFTGASSFTGMWFVEALVEAGHTVTTCFRSPLESYSGLRRQRIERLQGVSRQIFSCPFGRETFQQVVENEVWDLFCHHAADVTDYKSPDFDVAAALANNTLNLKSILKGLQSKGCQRVLLTGSVFEQREGAGSDDLRAVSPYGLSKGMTSDMFQFYTAILGMKLGKFVIPNPFGPYEEARYTTYLVRSWLEGKTPAVHFPDYVRDNIPVSLLAKAYRAFAERLTPQPGYEKWNPSFYTEDQGVFTQRFSREIGLRLSLNCDFELKKQIDFSEPRVRVNLDKLDPRAYGWDEGAAWDELAHYYQRAYR